MGDENPLRQKQIFQLLVHLINDNMKVIGTELGIKTNITTYSARHSFATTLKRSGANVSLISEMLGHSSLKTTQRYLDSFENETLENVAKALTNF